MREWENIPDFMRVEAVKEYYEILQRQKCSLLLKRIFDIIIAGIMVFILLPVFGVVSIMISLDSKGPISFRQTRVTTYGKKFKIFKFRTMIDNAGDIGSQVTTHGDARITKVGQMLRGSRLDELPQLINVLKGEMSFVGTRPEVVKYVKNYTDEMKATLLLPAGITSRASIEYKDEEQLIESAGDADEVYMEKILPEKMKINLQALKTFSFGRDIKTMLATIVAVIK